MAVLNMAFAVLQRLVCVEIMAELGALNIGIKDEILKTIEYLRMMGVLIPSSCQWGIGWAHSLLSLAFTARWNPKHT